MICTFKTIWGCLSLFPWLYQYTAFGPLFLRLGLAAVFIVHGYPKVKNFGGTVRWLESLGFRPGIFWATVVVGTEFFGGLFLIVGFLVQPVATLLVIDMLVAIWKVDYARGFKGGWELPFVLIVMALALLVLGPGAYSIDLPL